jgi:hypothetical protein
MDNAFIKTIKSSMALLLYQQQHANTKITLYRQFHQGSQAISQQRWITSQISEAEFLDEIQTKVSRVFLLAMQSHF